MVAFGAELGRRLTAHGVHYRHRVSEATVTAVNNPFSVSSSPPPHTHTITHTDKINNKEVSKDDTDQQSLGRINDRRDSDTEKQRLGGGEREQGESPVSSK